MNQIIFLIFGCLLIISALGFWVRRRNVVKSGEYTDATVVRTRNVREANMSSYSPVVRYTVNGCTYEVEGTVSHPKIKYRDGEVIKIIYNKKNFKKIVIVNDGPFWLILPGVFLFIGIGLIVLGFIIGRLL